MNAAITYTLPSIQLVCHLVMPSNVNNSSIKNRDSDAIQPTSTTPVPSLPPTIRLPSTTVPSVPRLPAGYVAYPDFGVAYKVYNNDVVSWFIAIEKCARDGARLAIVDSAAKVQAIWNQNAPKNYGHVGISQIGSDETWYNIYHGSSVPQSSLPWRSGEPSGSGHCALLISGGLGKYSCTSEANPMCEIPYP